VAFVFFVKQPWPVALTQGFEFHPDVVSSSRRLVVRAEGLPEGP
jgi:hypothetical protein